MPSCILHLQTPLDSLKEFYPSTRLIFGVPLRVFVCTAYVHSHGSNQNKFTPWAQACVFVRYSLHQRDYKCFHPFLSKYFVSMDVTFLEDRPFFLVSLLQKESVSEESNYMAQSKSLPILLWLPYLTQILTLQSYLQTKLPRKPTIGGISRRKLGLLLFSRL